MRELKPVQAAWRYVTGAYRRPTWHQFWDCVLAQSVAVPPPAMRQLMRAQALALYVTIYGTYTTPGQEAPAVTMADPHCRYIPGKES